MKVSLKSRTGSGSEKLGSESCFSLSEGIRDAACGLAFAAYVLSKERKSEASDKAVQITDVVAGLVTTANRATSISKALNASGYSKLAREAKSIGTAASKIKQELTSHRKNLKKPLGRLKQKDQEKLEISVKKLVGRMGVVSQEAREACRRVK